ncbi:hypothetical protein H6F90_12320 [Trichocoleus sp. FACHB-591]|uniref:hypothetical protein n=1 Tax=Trichocoleus sp. FACHB-591 TaxID=2692872 RepID=UPI0016841E61|nr:hypothetical protein [Trichocoleus sp. FACHB-591]MBD2095933.1 hypothetical protein [Trichocoleus sp. FACHB-591]
MGKNSRLRKERQQERRLTPDEYIQQGVQQWRDDRSLILADVMALAQADAECPELGIAFGRRWTPQEIQTVTAEVERRFLQ